MAAKFKRGGLHRLECASCPTYGYYTVAMIEDAGLPVCWREGCGDTLQPARIELALLLGADKAPVMAEYSAKVNSVARGQVSHVARGREVESPEFRALFGSKDEPGLIEQQRELARARRMAGLGLCEVKGSRRGERHVYRLDNEPMPF